MESINSNELFPAESNLNFDGPSSPILSTNKINRRIILNRKLHQRKSKTKLANQFVKNDLNLDFNQVDSPDSRLKAIEKLKSERELYYELLCKKDSSSYEENFVETIQQRIKSHSSIQENQTININQKDKNINQNLQPCNIQTASGKKIEIPEDIDEYKYIFDDILNNDQIVFKCPIKSNMLRVSKIPILNRNVKLKINKNTENNFSQPAEFNSELEVITQMVPKNNVNHSFCISPNGKEVAYKTSKGENILITESFIEAARNIVEEEVREDRGCEFEYATSKYGSNTMNKLYSNQKFDECSSSTNSLESLTPQNSVGLHVTDSEISQESSYAIVNTILTPAYDESSENKISVKNKSDCGNLSVMDIVNDDWSDTKYIVNSNKIEDCLLSICQSAVYNNIVTETKPEIVKIENCGKIRGNILQNLILPKELKIECNSVVDEDIKYNEIKNDIPDKTMKCNNKNLNDVDENNVSFAENHMKVKMTKLPSSQSTVSNSKSVIHVNIPPSILENQMEPIHSKNLIELHRNRNFQGNSEDSVSNLDLKLSEHSIHVKRKTLKTQKKKVTDEFVGFTKDIQELAHQKAAVFVKNVKEIEKEINDQGMIVPRKSKEEKKSKDKKIRKNKHETINDKEKEDSLLQECKVKHDKKRKEKIKQCKLKAVAEEKPGIVCEPITAQEGIYRTVTYDHMSIISEQSCKKYKEHKKRKSITTDKETISQNKNQAIELNPNQKKFKIEIDCNNKFHINICCNGVQSVCDKETIKCEKSINKCNKIDTKLSCKAMEITTAKAMFKSASGKFITINKSTLDNAEKGFLEIEGNTVTDGSKFVKQSSNELTKQENTQNQNNLEGNCDVNSTGNENIVKKFLNKAQKFYDDIRNTNGLLNTDRKLEHVETDFVKSVENTNNQIGPTSSNFFGHASEKTVNISERDMRNGAKANSIETDSNTHSVNQDNPISIDEKQFTQRIHVLYTDMANCDHDSKVEVPHGCKTVSDKFLKNILKTNEKKPPQLHGKQMHKNVKYTEKPFNAVTKNISCGFQSASGKSIKFSSHALSKAKRLFDDSNFSTESRNLASEPLKSKCNNIASGFQKASGHNIKISTDALDKAKWLFDDNNFQVESKDIAVTKAGGSKVNNVICDFDSVANRNKKIAPIVSENAKRIFMEGSANENTFSGFKSALGTKIEISEKQLSQAKKIFGDGDNTKLCMGDFKNSTMDGTCEGKIMPEETQQNGAGEFPQSLNNAASKKAFELLEDVVETVDCALENLRRSRTHREASVRKRLGISRCKQINISKEKIDKAKKLFSNESFNETIRDFSMVRTPSKKTHIGSSSTPLRNNMPLMKDVQFSNTSIESELTPIKNIRCNDTNYQPMNNQNASIIIQRKTPGTLNDWYGTVLKQIDSLKDTLKNLEEKKSNLEKQMGCVYYGDKEHRKQRPGVLYNKKTNQRILLKTLEPENVDIADSNVYITSKNAEMIHFNYSSLENIGVTQDGAVLIPNSQNFVGLSEIEMGFQTMAGVEPDLIPKGWIANHYRLIIWKLASYERYFPKQLQGSLSIENVVQQLKYRYDREIDRAQRPAIRKFLEKDDIPQKRMILCVSDIIQVPNNSMELELTDGWYCIRTIIDEPLIGQVKNNKIKIGTKLVIYGAQLLNCDGSHPLEVPDFVKLKISYNCTRRAVWYAKLGYQKWSEPFPVSLSSVHSDGGLIGCIKVHIIRAYPIRYMEQFDDRKVWRNKKAEEKYANNFDSDRLEKIEKIHYNIQQKFEQDQCLDMKNKVLDRSKLTKADVLNITCPKTLYSLMENSNDPDSLMETLLPSQRASVQEYRQHTCQQHQQEISRRISVEMEKQKLKKRKVTPILKLLVLDDYMNSKKPQQFCIWNPREDDMSFLKEGISLIVYNVVPRSNGDLFSNSKTYFKTCKSTTSYTKFKRQLLPISMVLDPYYQPLLNEFDTVGLVVKINVTNNDQRLWIADVTKRLLFVKIKDGPEICCLFDGIARGQVVLLQNLIYCKPQKDFGQALANQFSIISNSLQQNYLQDMEMFKRKLPEDLTQLLDECEENIQKYMTQIDMQNCFITSLLHQNSGGSFISCIDVSDDSTLVSSRMTETDVAMSLIDTDKFN